MKSSRSINLGLAAFLCAECVWGIIHNSSGLWDTVWWLIVATIMVFNVVRRIPALEEDNRWWVWIVCAFSTLHFLAFEYSEETRIAFWTLLILIMLADLNLLYLGRSFAILPARRSIRTGMLYKYVRHPIYSMYMLCDFIYTFLAPSIRNVSVLIIGVALFALRSELEERLWRHDPAYQNYAKKTRWRFLPGLF
jgi:protein-S-isoprenylcysteine O-methyltransferase Ste14